MGEVLLNASSRSVQGKFREKGFVPGIVYGRETDTTPVKFEEQAIRKTLSNQGSNARVWVEIDNNPKKFGFIKEVQWHLTKDQLLHIDVQLVSKSQEINMQIPIIFKGIEDLRSKQLRLHVNKSEIDAKGKMEFMPDSIEIDASELNYGDNVTIKDFNLSDEINVYDEDDEIYATVVHLESISEDELETADSEEMPEPALVGETE